MSPEAKAIIDLYFPVLDHGFVALKDVMGDDAAVAEAARVSYGAGTTKKSDERGLIRYLKRHTHTTPFEMVEFKFHMKLPIFVARQLIRHRTANVNEYSGRYSLMPMLFYTPKRENFGLQSDKNKQGRGEQATEEAFLSMKALSGTIRQFAAEAYENFVKMGIARELARIDLPLSMYTEWYWKIDLHNLMHFLGLRVDSHAQFEIREFGRVMAGMVKAVAPLSFEAWVDYHLMGRKVSRMEMLVLRRALTGQTVYPQEMSQVGMSQREIDEFIADFFKPKSWETPSFDLDLSKAKEGSFFFEEAQAAVPKIDTPEQV